MIDPRRLQRHLRAALRSQARASRVGAFTLFVHPDTSDPTLNVAIPDEPPEGRRVPLLELQARGEAAVPEEDVTYALMVAKAQLRAQRRTPRVEFLAGCHPELPALLAVAGFAEATRLPLLASTSAAWRPAPAVEGLAFEPILPRTPWETTRRYLEVQREAFALSIEIPRDAPRDAWPALGIGAGVLVTLDGAPVAAGGFTPPEDQLVEVRGLAVVPGVRGRGIGTLLLNALARVAHEGGVEAALAIPETDAATQLARRAGYEQAATIVAYEAPKDA